MGYMYNIMTELDDVDVTIIGYNKLLVMREKQLQPIENIVQVNTAKENKKNAENTM